MANHNPLHDAIYNKIVKPALSDLTHDTEGWIVAVDYYAQKVNVEWIDPTNGTRRQAEGLHIPMDANGVYKQAPQIGDQCRLAFKYADIGYPYITMLYTNGSRAGNYFHTASTHIPKSLGYL